MPSLQGKGKQMMTLNLPEILVANGAGAVMVCFLLLFRVRQQKRRQIHERIFSAIQASILLGLAAETTSFLIDGKSFSGCAFLQYLTNFLCLGLMGVVGFLWCLFVDYRLFCSAKRLKYKAALLSLPLLVSTGLLVGDLFGHGVVFSISPDNRYIRGELNHVLYIISFFYYLESLAKVHRARRKGNIPFFFPVHCFIVPCMAGAVIQACHYGIAVGWMTTAMAAVFVCLELQTENSYMDVVSGLFNRQYLTYHLSQVAQRSGNHYGILLDIDDFKSINDAYGHTVGDHAIQEMGKILSRAMLNNATAIRMGGDEFVVILSDSSSEECRTQMEAIQRYIDKFNRGASESFWLSVSMGSARFAGQSAEKFLAQMDETMYEMKRKHHSNKQLQKKLAKNRM